MTTDSITVQACESESVEYVDLFIPIVRYSGCRSWSASGSYDTKQDAINAIKCYSGIVDAKILIHTEKFVLDK